MEQSRSQAEKYFTFQPFQFLNLCEISYFTNLKITVKNWQLIGSFFSLAPSTQKDI
jgi:hypothetical protein